MGVFSNVFRRATQGALGKAKDLMATNSFQSIIQSVNRYRSHIKTTSGKNDSLFSALTMDYSLMDDKFVENSEFNYDDDEPVFAEVDSDLVESFVDGISEAVHDGDASSTEAVGLVITDSAGRAYDIVDQRSNDVIIDGKKILFSSSFIPSKISEGVVIQDEVTGKIYLNNFLRTSNFAKPDAARVLPDTIFGKLSSIALISGGAVSSEDDIESMLTRMNVWNTDIATSISDWCTQLQITGSGVIDDDLALIWEHYNIAYPIRPGAGYIVPLWNIVRDGLESSALNSMIGEACDVIMNSASPAVGLNSMLQEAEDSKYNSVRTFAKNASAAYSNGGIAGLAQYVLSFAKSLASSDDVQENEDGTFDFTDNSKLIPKAFLSGVLSVIVQGVGAVLVVLGGMFLKILGMAITLIAGVVSAVRTAASNLTFATVSTDSNFGLPAGNYESAKPDTENRDGHVLLPIAPHGCLQYEMAYDTFMNSDLSSLLEQGHTLGYVEIPGGYVLFGPGSYNNDGTVDTIRLELHPSVVYDGECLGNIVDFLRTNDLIKLTMIGHPGPTATYVHMHATIDWDSDTFVWQTVKEALRERILLAWETYSESSVLDNDGTDNQGVPKGCLSSSKDQMVRRNVLRNLTTMCLFMATLAPSTTLDCFNNPDANTVWAYFATEYQTEALTGKHVFSLVPSTMDSHISDIGLWYCLLYWGGYHDIPLFVTYVDDLGQQKTIPIVCNPNHTSYKNSPLSWAKLVIGPVAGSNALNIVDGVYGMYYGLFSQFQYYNEIYIHDSAIKYAIQVPAYDARSFWTNIVFAAVVTAVVATVVVVASLKVRKAIAKKRSMNEARIAAAYDNLTKDPSDENYMAYRKAVKKNNLWANFIGGSKFNYESYWAGAQASSQGSTVEKVKSIVNKYGASDQSVNGDDQFINNEESNDVRSLRLQSEIVTLIKGPDLANT